MCTHSHLPCLFVFIFRGRIPFNCSVLHCLSSFHSFLVVTLSSLLIRNWINQNPDCYYPAFVCGVQSTSQTNLPRSIWLAVHSFSTFFIVFILLHPYSPPFLSFFPSLIHCKVPSWFEPIPRVSSGTFFSIFSSYLNTFGANATCADFNWLLWYLAPTTTVPALPFAQRARATAIKVVLYGIGGGP